MPDCQDQERQALIHKLASDAALEASQTLLEHAISIQDSDAIKVSQQLIEKALISKNAWNANLTWTGTAWAKTVANVMAKGMPSPVKSGQCKIEDCPACFYENICRREETAKIIQRNRDVVASCKQSYEKWEEALAFKAKLDRTKGVDHTDYDYVNSPTLIWVKELADELRGRQQAEEAARKTIIKQKQDVVHTDSNQRHAYND